MRTLVPLLCLLLAAPALAKKPKGPPMPAPEVVEAFTAYANASTQYYEAYQAAGAYDVQQMVWGLGDFGAQFQERLDALKVASDAAEQKLMDANAAMNLAATNEDIAGIAAQTAILQTGTLELAGLVDDAAKLKAEVAAYEVPKTIALAEIATTEGMTLQRIFKAAGWHKENAGVGTMLTTGYAYWNFDVAKDGKVLNVSVIHPDASADGEGGAKPADVVERRGPDAVLHYHKATDTLVEVIPRDGATAADARALMDAVILP